MRRLLLVFIGLALLVSPAWTQLAPGPDWTEQTIDGGTAVIVSPADANGQQIVMIVGTADPEFGDHEPWFDIQVDAIVSQIGALATRDGMRSVESAPDDDISQLYGDEVQIRTDDGAIVTATIYSYRTKAHRQPMAVIYPVGLALPDPRGALAGDKIRQLWRTGFLQMAPGAAPLPAPDPVPAPAPDETAESPPPTPPAPTPDPAPAPSLPEPTATPGAIGEAAVEAVVIGAVVRMGGPVISVRVPFLLLKDGRSIQEVEQSPLDYNPSVRKPDTFEPAAWVTAPDGGYKVNYPDGSFYELDASGRLGPAPPNFALNGTYIARGGRYGANWAEKLTFANGTVTSGQTAIVSGPDYDGGGSVSNSGAYTVSGWTLTMPAANGQPMRYLFAKDNEAAPRVICIGYTLYLRE
jgi:hypothetical protein